MARTNRRVYFWKEVMVLKLKEMDSRSSRSKDLPYKAKPNVQAGIGSFTTALIIYLCLNLLMATNPFFFSKNFTKRVSWEEQIWWAIQHYMSLKVKPEIFFWALLPSQPPLMGQINYRHCLLSPGYSTLAVYSSSSNLEVD